MEAKGKSGSVRKKGEDNEEENKTGTVVREQCGGGSVEKVWVWRRGTRCSAVWG